MEHAVKHLEKDYNAFGEEFRMFFPELTDYARRIISVNGAQ
jgi:hypothetical protein